MTDITRTPTEPPAKTCPCCHRQYSREAFEALRLPSKMAPESRGRVRVDYDDGGYDLQIWRQCAPDCENTMIILEVAA